LSTNAANDVLNCLAANVRDIVRLMIDDNTNREICLDKVDSCLSHLDRVRGVVEQGNFIAVKNSLHGMRRELILGNIVDGDSNPVKTFYCAHRQLSGK